MGDYRIIKVFEDTQHQLQLSHQEIRDILAMKSIIGEGNLILQSDGKLFIRHYVGFVQVNNTRILIYPKISRNGESEYIYNKSFNILIKLLSYSEFLKVKNLPTPQLMNVFKGDLLELFVSLFIDELLRLIKRDINRGYNQNLEDQVIIKGKIDFSETIKKNSFRKHRHFVKYDEFTDNILLNNIFKSVILNLINRTTIKENKVKLRQALLWLEDVDSVPLINDVWDKVKFTRLNIQYQTVFNMAKLLYFNSSPNLNKGDELTFSFLVPVNQLFEKYLYKILYNNSQDNIDVHYQGPTKNLAIKNGKEYMQMRPDITLSRDGKIIQILDAKYKEINENSISQSDIYQMLAYGIRYDCKNVALLYPKFLDEFNSESLVAELTIENKDEDILIKIIKIDLEARPDNLMEEIREILNY